MKNFFVYTNPYKDPEYVRTREICNFLMKQGCRVVLHKEGEEDFPQKPDCFLVLGGDGTILRAARMIPKKEGCPILGINLGTLGYMAEIEPEQMEVSIEKLLRGEFELEKRMMLEGEICTQDGSLHQEDALNDIVISKCGMQQVLEFSLYVNGRILKKYLADGIIITSPTGSTGYNLSAGGPIVEPKAELFVVTPICPHTINQRSIVLAPEDEIVIEILSGKEGRGQEAAVRFDGQPQELKNGDLIRIRKGNRTMDFIKLSQEGFLETLHKKMSDY